jgi:hypothetical protein
MSERDICERLEAPAYWISGSSEGHDGENDAPREAATTIRALRALLRRADSLLAEFPSDASYGSSEEWRDRVRMFLEERS